MNERIRQLHDQAIVIEDGEDYACGELDPVKFAELIVNDCLQALQTTDRYRSDYFIAVVKQHFGVE